MVLNFLNLQFHSPLLSWGLLLIAVPIIVHLFNLRRAKKIEFSNTRLLRQVHEESTARRRPVEILILLSRVFGIALLVLAFAQPFFKEDDSSNEISNEVVIYLDNSVSMSKNGEDGSLYDRAYALVDGLIQSYPEGTTFRLLENSFESSVSTKHTATSILNYLTVLKQVGIDRTGEEIVSRKSTEDISGDFYWLSDFDAINGMSGVISDSSSQIKLVPTFSEYPSNIFIDTVYLENTFYSGQFSNNLVVRLASNIKLQETVNLRFSIDGKLLGTAQVAFNNSSNTDYKYKIPEGIGDLSKILIELEASDPVYDNQIYLSVNQLEQVNILEVFQDDSNDYISSLYNENELFEFRRLNIDALQNSFFKQFDFIILNELTSFSNQLVKSITSFVENNCTLLVIPNSEMPLAELARLNILVNEDDNKRIDLESIDFDIPFYEGIFEEEESELNMPDASTKFKINNVEYALLSFENGRPFLSKVSDNNSIYFISSSLKSMYSTFANHAIFVPIMYKLALGAKTNASRLYYYTDDEFLVFPSKIIGQNTLVKLISDEKSIVPDQRRSNGQIELEIPKNQLSPGHYTLVTQEDTLGVLSFNLPKSESYTNANKIEQLNDASKFEHISVLDLNSKEQASNYVSNSIIGTSLWRYFLLGAIFFLFAEIILIRYL